MPRRKSEKSHPWPPPPPLHATTTTTPVKSNILSSVESSNRFNDEVDVGGFQKAAAASVLVDRFAFAGLSSKPAASQEDDGPPKTGQGLRQNRSLEALFQAADSELQNYSARNPEPPPPTKLVSEDGDAGGTRVPDALGVHVQNSVSVAPSYPVFRLNFHADPQTELGSLPSGLSPQGVFCIKVVNANPAAGGQLAPETNAALQAVGILPGHGCLQQLQPALKPEKSSSSPLVNRPGKHVCPYCSRFCAKPSVLQKHIRTHTGERPYPCNECGFRFKTKSNLYKHCKSRVHLTKRESESQTLDCTSGSDSQIPSEEMEDQDDLSPEVSMEIAAADDDEPERQESPKTVPLASLGLKYFSCDALQGGSTDADALNFSSATSRSLSVPESNEDKVSVGLHSLLRLSDGTIYLMEKMSNGHAMLRPVLQEVALPAAISVPHSFAASHSRPAEPPGFGSLGAVPISAVTTEGKNCERERQIFALEAARVQNEVRRTSLLPENVGARHIQMLQKPSSANADAAAAAAANNKPEFNSFPMLQLNEDSVCVVEKAATALPRPILQEATHHHLMPLAAAVSSMSSSFSRGSEINVSSKVASIQLKAGMGPVPSSKEQQYRGPEKPAIHFEGQPVLSIPSRSRHSKYLHKSSSAGVPAMAPNPNIMISHRSLSVPGSHNVSIAPKMAPMDPKNVTPEAVQERIAMLISQNASIIDTPMADAPRPKRVLRHNSEAATASAHKPDSSSLSAAKSLQRAKSLTPLAAVSSTVLKNDPSPISAGLEAAGLSVSASPTAKTQKAEFTKSSNPLSKTTSKFLLVPTDPNLQGTPLSLKSVIGQVASYPLSINSPIQRTIPPVKAKSLELSAASPKEMVASSYSSNVSVGRTIEGDKSESETPDVHSWKPFPVSQDIQMVFQLPSSATIDLPQPAATRLDGNLSPILAVTKDVAERRQEFARTHLMLENGGKGQVASQVMTPIKSVGAHLDDILRMNSALPVQYLVIAANADQSPAFVPVVAPAAFPTFRPQATAAFEAAPQDQPVSIGVSESQVSFSGNREKTSNQQNVDRSCAPALSSGATFRSIPSICITPADANPSAETSESLWKIKLKGRLLMKRSLNIEKALSEERENVPKVMPDAGKLASLPSNEAFQPLNSDSDVLQASGFLRSRSCDAAMPLKKRRKTLTELGRGTAFGTRVEDANEANQSGESKSRPSTRYRVEFLKDAPRCVGFDEDAFLDQPEGKEISEQRGFCGTGSNLLPAPAEGPIVRAFVPHFTPSMMSFSAAAEKQPDAVGIPRTLPSNIPGFVSERCSIRPPLQSVPGAPVSRQVMMTERPETPRHTVSNDEPSRSVDCDPLALGKSKTDSETDRCGETGVAAASDCSGKIDEAAVQSGTGPVMLLFSHLYPSLNVTTTPTFCSVVKPQPTYISQDANKKLSMYSNWRVASPIGDSEMPGLSVSDMLALCQRNRTVLPHQYATSNISEPKSGVLTHSSYWNFKKELEMKSSAGQEVGKSSDTRVDSVEESASHSADKNNGVKFSGEKSRSHDAIDSPAAVKAVSCGGAQEMRAQDGPNVPRKEAKRIQICPGGYKSNEEYVYVRGRGKGKFVCELCGIRCKKPCMLVKHIRTHSDVRPHHCDVCSFGFKTKGNLSKHLKSKAHHLKCGDHDSSHSHAVSTNSGDQPVDSSQLLDLNVSSSSCDLHEEEMGEDDDDDELRGCKEDNDEDKDDTDDDDDDDDDNDDDDADDVETVDADERKSLTRVCSAEYLSASEANKTSENTVDQYYNLPPKGDRLRAVTDSEAAASLLDLSKGNEAMEVAIMSSSCDGPSIVSLPLPSLNPSLPYQVSLVNSNINQEACDVTGRTDVSSTLKSADFGSSVLLLTNYTNPSFQLPSPICFAVSNASMLSSIPNSRNQPWIILNPATLMQKPADFSGHPLIQEVERQDLDPDLTTSTSAVPGSECFPVSSSVPPSSATASPVVGPAAPPVTETAAAHGSHWTHCEIIPVPGKVSGNIDECVNGKYVCGICRKSYHEPHHLTMHKNVHYLERPFPCSACGVSFQNRALLERHQRSERHACRSDDPRPFKCDPCGVAFRIHGHLAKHLRSKMHTAKCESGAERGSSADDCYEEQDGDANAPFPSSESADGTAVSDGANETCLADAAFEAEVAESSSNESATIMRYKDACVSTSTQFVNSSALSLPTGVTIVTPSGQKISLSQLQRQKQSVKDVLLTTPLQCDMCTKTFTDVSLFEKHINTHIELRPYICDICDAGFTSARLLESHMETHNKTKDHVCGVCGDSLVGKSSPQMETPLMSGVRCVTPNYKRVLTASPGTGNQCSTSPSDTFMVCPLQILQENAAAAAGGAQLPPTHSAAAADGKNCVPVSESAVPGGAGSQLRVIPMQNVFSLSDSRVLLMKHFGGAAPLPKSVGNGPAPFDLDSVSKATSGHVIHVIEAAQDPVRPSNVLVATSSPPGADAVCRSASDDVVYLRDVRQQRLAVQAKGVEPVCRLLTVSFRVGENVSSRLPVSSGGSGARENVFVAPDPAELLPKHVSLINSASNSVLTDDLLMSFGQTVSL